MKIVGLTLLSLVLALSTRCSFYKPKTTTATATTTTTTSSFSPHLSRKIASLNPSSLKNRFLNISGLRLGDYLSAGRLEDCLQGRIEVLEISNSTLSILIGGRLLVSGIKDQRHTSEFSDRNCQHNRETLWTGTQVNFKTSRRCLNTSVESVTVITFPSPGRIDYSIVTKENGLLKQQLRCRLEKRP